MAKIPASWEGNPLFCRMKRAIDQVKVFNDVAKRVVALITTFDAAKTREAQKQFLLKVVAKSRRECPTTSKAAVLEPE